MRSTWGDRDAGRWIDQTTNLFVGTAAEAYLASESQHRADRPVSVFAIGVDRLDALTAARGRPARDAVLAQVANALASIGAPIAVIATSYPDAVFVVVAPELEAGGGAPGTGSASALRTDGDLARHRQPRRRSPPTASPSRLGIVSWRLDAHRQRTRRSARRAAAAAQGARWQQPAAIAWSQPVHSSLPSIRRAH